MIAKYLLIGMKLRPVARKMLQQHLKSHNDALPRASEREQTAPRSVFYGKYTKPEYAARFRDFLKLDKKTGQLIAPDSKPLRLALIMTMSKSLPISWGN